MKFKIFDYIFELNVRGMSVLFEAINFASGGGRLLAHLNLDNEEWIHFVDDRELILDELEEFTKLEPKELYKSLTASLMRLYQEEKKDYAVIDIDYDQGRYFFTEEDDDVNLIWDSHKDAYNVIERLEDQNRLRGSLILIMDTKDKKALLFKREA